MSHNISRRSLVKKSAAGAAAASIAALGARGIRPAAAQVATPEATPAVANPGEIVIPEPQVELPTDDVTFRWIDSGDLKALFYKPFFEAYQEAHSNITIQYDPLPWEEINRIVPLGVQNGDAHDVFAKPQDIPGGQMVAEGWVAPLDDIVPNFEEWKSRFPYGTFIEGVHIFNGKTYVYPLTSSKRYWTMTFYNTELVQNAGYDLENERMTWDQYREAARKITEQGQGQFYGVIFGAKSTGRLSTFVRNLGRQAGAPGGGSLGFEDIDWRTGEFQYTSDQYLAAIDLLLALKADGSIFPGSLSLSEAQARAQFPQGIAGMLLEGPWNIPQWQTDSPDFNFGLASQPIPNDGESTPLTYEENGSNVSWVYADSPYKNIAGDMFSYMGSVEGQVALMAKSQGNLRALIPESVEIATSSVELDPYATEALKLYDEQMRMGPIVTVRNPETSQVAFERRTLTPDFGDIVQGLLVGQITDPKAAMQDLQDRTNAELDRALKAAQDKGAEVSRDDFVFPNWDPAENYTQEDYEEL